MKNTADEAVAVKELKSPSKRIILVTSAFHMYRAKKLFEKKGFKVVHYQFYYKASRNYTATLMNFLPSEENVAKQKLGKY